MKFLNIKIPFIIVVLIFLIISGGLGIFYWQKIYLPLEAPTPSDISLETVQEKCIADVNQMTDEELISQIKELKYPHIETDIVGSDGVLKDRMSWGQNQMSKYLICKVGVDPGNEGIYNKAKKFIEESKFGEEYKENKQFYFSMLDQAHSRKPYKDQSFPMMLAISEFTDICPDRLNPLPLLVEDCLTGAQKSIPSSVKEKFCHNICEKLEKYSKDSEFLTEEVLNFTNWSEWTDNWGDDYSEIKPRYQWRLAAGYRFRGEEGALKVCSNLPSTEELKKDCLNRLELIKEAEKAEKDCTRIKEIIISTICYLPNE